MNVLYIDTTTNDLVVALIRRDGIIDASQRAMGVKHSETLCGKVAELLKIADITFDEIDAYACAIGPGSFTGIRIGISTVKGYATANPRPQIAVNCLEAIACSPNCGNRGFAVIDAGNGYYCCTPESGTLPNVIAYDDEIAKRSGKAEGAADYLDGAAEIIRIKYANGDFCSALAPLYIRRSQAEINLKKADNRQ
mgnify:CR=1 FL=1